MSVFKNDISELFGKRFYYSKRSASGDFNVIKPHTHEHYEIYYLTRGNRRYFIKNKIYFVGCGDIVFIKPNTLHYTTSARSDEHERILLNFTEEYVSARIADELNRLCKISCISIPADKQAQVEMIMQKTAAEYETHDKFSDVIQSNLISELIVTVLRSQTNGGAENATGLTDKSPILETLDFIGENLSNEISLEQAADFAGFSKSHFSKIFKEETGFTFGAYLQLQRLVKARRMLEKTRDSVIEIADECGFMSSGYFSTVFKNYFGMTPLEYRKKNQK